MPVCPKCGVAYLDHEAHHCVEESGWRALWKVLKVVLLISLAMLVSLVILVAGMCGLLPWQ
jgi:hypothetical protein